MTNIYDLKNQISASLPAIVMGAVIGILIIIVEISFAAMVYSKDMAEFAAKGAEIYMTGALVMCAGLVFFSSVNFFISLPQDAPVAILAAGAAAMSATMGDIPPEAKFATITACVALSSILTGLCYYLLGKFHLADFVRFLPYPVVGGFLAGTGLLLIKGSFGVMADLSFSFQSMGMFLIPQKMLLWMPGVAFALLLFFVLAKWSHYLILPGLLLAGVGIFHLLMVAANVSMQEAENAGMFFTGVSQNSFLPQLPPMSLSLIEWEICFYNIPIIMTVVLISMVGFLLNVSAAEVASGCEVDLNRELGFNGASNIIAGMFGSPPGYPALSLSMLGPRTGVKSKIIGIATSLILGIVILFDADVITYFPRPLLGSLLFLLGLFFIKEWVLDARKKLTLPDYLVVLSILVVIGFFGFLQGVSLGLALTIIIFVFRFSQVPVIGEIIEGENAVSTKKRPITERHLLSKSEQKIIVFKLKGYIFFGSASFMINRIIENIESGSDKKFIILDFADVQGFDISAVNNFNRLARKLQIMNRVLAMSAAPKTMIMLLEPNLSQELRQLIIQSDSLNNTLMLVEDRILEKELFELKSDSNKDKNKRHQLFNMVSDDYMLELEKLEHLESMMSALKDYVQKIKFESSKKIISASESVDGLYIIEWGSVSEVRSLGSGSQEKIKGLGPGDVIAPNLFFTKQKSCTDFISEKETILYYIDRKNFHNIESEQTQSILKLYKYFLKQQCLYTE